MTLEQRHKDLLRQSDRLFEKRSGLLSLWQDFAEQFYPRRAEFTVVRNIGADYASDLDTSYPVLARRDLGNAISAMLRPAASDWFFNKVAREDTEDESARKWLERADQIQRRAMYDPVAQMVASTKEADHDYITFGNAAISIEMVLDDPEEGPHLLYRCWHLRDMAWRCNKNGKVDNPHRKWKPTAGELIKYFPKTVSDEVRRKYKDDPDCEVQCRHIVIPAADYESLDKKKFRLPYVSVWIDCEHSTLLEESPSVTPVYVIPRWGKISGSQYAMSPAAEVAIADARALQMMAYILMEAGEKAVDPPMIGVQEALRSDLNLWAGGFTAVDADYDEKTGEVLRPLTIKTDGIPLGLEMTQDTRNMLAEAFYLNRLSPFPQTQDKDETAYEVGQRIQDWARNVTPLLEPIEQEYNAPLCENTFDILMHHGAFGPLNEIPESLSGAQTQFTFESPLTQAKEKIKARKFIDAKLLATEAQPMDQMAMARIDWEKAHIEAQRGLGTPADWMRDEREVEQIKQQQAQQQQAQQLMQTIGQGAAVAEQVGKASKLMAETQATMAGR